MRGLRQVYYPPVTEEFPVFEWSFMRKSGTITLASADGDYDLPDDFSGEILDDSVSTPAGNLNPPLIKVSESDIRRELAENNSTGFPKYYAVRNKTHAPTTGQRYEFLVYPIPGSTAATGNTIVLTYRYVTLPNVIDATNIYPLGGARYSELILTSFLAIAEEMLDDESNGMYANLFKQRLISAMRSDLNIKENNRGGAS